MVGRDLWRALAHELHLVRRHHDVGVIDEDEWRESLQGHGEWAAPMQERQERLRPIGATQGPEAGSAATGENDRVGSTTHLRHPSLRAGGRVSGRAKKRSLRAQRPKRRRSMRGTEMPLRRITSRSSNSVFTL